MSDNKPKIIYQEDGVNGFRIVRRDPYGKGHYQFIVETCDEDAMGETTWRHAGVFTYDQWDSIGGHKTFSPGNDAHLLYWLLAKLTGGVLKTYDGALLPAYQVKTELLAE